MKNKKINEVYVTSNLRQLLINEPNLYKFEEISVDGITESIVFKTSKTEDGWEYFRTYKVAYCPPVLSDDYLVRESKSKIKETEI